MILISIAKYFAPSIFFHIKIFFTQSLESVNNPNLEFNIGDEKSSIAELRWKCTAFRSSSCSTRISACFTSSDARNWKENKLMTCKLYVLLSEGSKPPYFRLQYALFAIASHNFLPIRHAQLPPWMIIYESMWIASTKRKNVWTYLSHFCIFNHLFAWLYCEVKFAL